MRQSVEHELTHDERQTRARLPQPMPRARLDLSADEILDEQPSFRRRQRLQLEVGAAVVLQSATIASERIRPARNVTTSMASRDAASWETSVAEA